MVKTHVKQLMREWRAKNQTELSYAKLAELTGKGDRTVRRWANNEIDNFDGSVLAAMCNFFDVGIEDVLYLSENGDEA